MATVTFVDASRVYPGADHPAVDKLSLEVGDGEFMVLVGPSGCGKSTSLRMLAGLEEVNTGNVYIGDRDVTDLPPKDRDIAMVFQNYALYPHMTVADNMGFALKMQGVGKQERAERVLEAAKLRVEMRTYIAILHRKLNTTTVYVTHDQTEAMTLGDRVCVMREGRLEQVDVPATLYAKPANLFVAGFMGSPAMNIIRSRLSAEGGSIFAELGPTKLQLPPSFLKERRQLEQYVGRELILGIRPEDIEDAALAPTVDGEASLDVEVALAEPMGSEVIIHFPVDAEPVAGTPSAVAATDSKDRQELAQLIAENKTSSTAMVARLNSRTTARTGKPARLAVDVNRLYFFDPDSEAAIW